MFTEIENIDTGVKYQIELPTKCPFCGVSLSPRIEGKLFRRPTKLCTDVFMYAYLILFCPNCDDRFYAKYTIPDNGPSRRVAVYPVSKPKISLPTILREKYPDFWEAYRQAVIAEANNLNPLCGMGYRRALEILTKQHLIDHYDKTEAEINWRIQGDTKEYDWWSFLEKINEHIDSTTNSEDKKLGFFFCKAKDNVISSETFVGKVIFYLWNDVFKDYGFDDSIFDDVDGSKLSFNKFYSTDSKGMTIVQKDKVERFLDNLGVAIAGEIDDEEFIDSDSDENEDDNVDKNVDYNNQGGGNDYSKFSINGSGQYNKGAVVYDAIKMYCDNNPTMSAEDVVAKWLALNVKMPNLVETEAVHEQRRQKGNDPFFDRRSNVLVLKDGTKIFVSTQFTKSRINDLISKVNSQNWGITIAKV